VSALVQYTHTVVSCPFVSRHRYIGGHSDVVMGVVCTNRLDLYERLRFVQNSLGAVPSPFDCFLAHRGLKTLHLRMEASARYVLFARHAQAQTPPPLVDSLAPLVRLVGLLYFPSIVFSLYDNIAMPMPLPCFWSLMQPWPRLSIPDCRPILNTHWQSASNTALAA
jgi:Cys/Met metabolism PLP-dependent enzyme